MVKLKNKYLLYILFTLFITVLFLYIQFPGDSVCEYTELKINRNPNFNIDITSSALTIPPGISFGNIFLDLNSKRSKLSDNIKVSPSYLSLFSSFKISGDLFGGIIRCTLAKNGMNAGGTLSGLSIEKLPIDLISAIPKGITCSGTADINFSIKNTDKKSDGSIELKLRNLSINAENQPIKKIIIENVNAYGSIENRIIKLNSIDILSSDFTAKIDGKIIRANNPENSTLDLKCMFSPKQSALEKYGNIIPFKMIMGNKKSINFKIEGTLKKPFYKFI